MLDSIYHMMFKLLWNRKFGVKGSDFIIMYAPFQWMTLFNVTKYVNHLSWLIDFIVWLILLPDATSYDKVTYHILSNI